MKKIGLIILFLFMLVFNSFANDLPEGVIDAKTLQIHMRQIFYYGHDRVLPDFFEYFQKPEILEFTRVGDCDDFSIYSDYYLNILKYRSQKYILILEEDGEKQGHAVTVFLDNDGTYSVFSNQYVFKTSKFYPVDAIKDVYSSWFVICKWNPTKFGYLTHEEVWKDTTLVEYKNLQAYYYFFAKKTILGK